MGKIYNKNISTSQYFLVNKKKEWVEVRRVKATNNKSQRAKLHREALKIKNNSQWLTESSKTKRKDPNLKIQKMTSQQASSTSQQASSVSQQASLTSQPVSSISQQESLTSQPVSSVSQPANLTSQQASLTSQQGGSTDHETTKALKEANRPEVEKGEIVNKKEAQVNGQKRQILRQSRSVRSLLLVSR